jgi:hypothetical protein
MRNHQSLAAAVLLLTVWSVGHHQEIDPRLLWTFETGG